VIPSVKRQSEYQGYRSGPPERTITMSSMPVLVGAAMIAAAILLSTLLSAIGTRYIGIEGPTEESAWLVDRLTGRVYRCEAAQRGKAACDSEIRNRQHPRAGKTAEGRALGSFARCAAAKNLSSCGNVCGGEYVSSLASAALAFIPSARFK